MADDESCLGVDEETELSILSLYERVMIQVLLGGSRISILNSQLVSCSDESLQD